MNEITWLSHGGPGSGRYPKGSGKNPRGAYKKLKKIASKDYKYSISDSHKKMSKFISKEQDQTLSRSGSDLRKAINSVYDSNGYVRKSATANNAKALNAAEKIHKYNSEKIAREILGKYGDIKISVIQYGQSSLGKKMKKSKNLVKAEKYLSGNLYTKYN